MSYLTIPSHSTGKHIYPQLESAEDRPEQNNREEGENSVCAITRQVPHDSALQPITFSMENHIACLRDKLMKLTEQREKAWSLLPTVFESMRLWKLFIGTLPLPAHKHADLFRLAEELKIDFESKRGLSSLRAKEETRGRVVFTEHLFNEQLSPAVLRKMIREVHAASMIILLETEDLENIVRKTDLLYLRKGIEELLLFLATKKSREALALICSKTSSCSMLPYAEREIMENLRTASTLLKESKKSIPETMRLYLEEILMDEKEPKTLVFHQLNHWGCMLYSTYFKMQVVKHLNTSFLNEEEGILKGVWER